MLVVRAMAAIYGVAAIYLTLGVPPWSPNLARGDGSVSWLLISPADDLVINAVMLLPLGAIVADGWPRRSLVRSTVAVAALALAVELLQANVFTYRTAQLSDIVLNVAGFAAGFAWTRWIDRSTAMVERRPAA